MNRRKFLTAGIGTAVAIATPTTVLAELVSEAPQAATKTMPELYRTLADQLYISKASFMRFCREARIRNGYLGNAACAYPDWRYFVERIVLPLNTQTFQTVLELSRLHQTQDGEVPYPLVEFMDYHSTFVHRDRQYRAGQLTAEEYRWTAGYNFPYAVDLHAQWQLAYYAGQTKDPALTTTF